MLALKEALRGEDADLDTRTRIKIARPKCNNYANCYLIFAVDEARQSISQLQVSAVCSVSMEMVTSFWSLRCCFVA
jgi:hypothetical protein